MHLPCQKAFLRPFLATSIAPAHWPDELARSGQSKLPKGCPLVQANASSFGKTLRRLDRPHDQGRYYDGGRWKMLPVLASTVGPSPEIAHGHKYNLRMLKNCNLNEKIINWFTSYIITVHIFVANRTNDVAAVILVGEFSKRSME